MQSNYVMYCEYDDDAHAYTNPSFRYVEDEEDDNEYSEIQMEQMIRLKSVRGKTIMSTQKYRWNR